MKIFRVNWVLLGGDTHGWIEGTSRRELVKSAAAIISGYGESGRIMGNFVYLKTDLSADCLYVSKKGRISKM